jgi:hypothetical protein
MNLYILIIFFYFNICLFYNPQISKKVAKIKKYMIKKYHLYNKNSLITYNQKLQWTKIFNCSPLRTLLVDKYLVRKWIEKKIGAKYLNNLLGVFNNFDDINFNKLPNKFVIKCNHGSGMNKIIKDKKNINIAKLRNYFNIQMKTNFGFINYELQYVNVSRKIIIEEYMENKNGDLNDYRIFCFNGKPHYIIVDSGSHSHGLHRKMSLYDINWNFINITQNNIKIHNPPISKPKNLKEILQIATILSQGFNHVRVDLYIFDNNDIKFGEMTFQHTAGYGKWSDENFNKHLGDLLELKKDDILELKITKKLDL